MLCQQKAAGTCQMLVETLEVARMRLPPLRQCVSVLRAHTPMTAKYYSSGVSYDAEYPSASHSSSIARIALLGLVRGAKLNKPLVLGLPKFAPFFFSTISKDRRGASHC